MHTPSTPRREGNSCNLKSASTKKNKKPLANRTLSGAKEKECFPTEIWDLAKMYLLSYVGTVGLGPGKRQWAREVMGRMCPTCITKPRQRLIRECRRHRECLHHPTSALRSTLHFFSSACLLLVLLSITTFIMVDFYSLFLWHYLILLSLLFSSFSLLPVFVSFLLPEDTEVTDFSLSSIHRCACKSTDLPLSTDHAGSHVFPLVFSNPVPAAVSALQDDHAMFSTVHLQPLCP